MSYFKSDAVCDWCRNSLGNRHDVCCRACHEKLEQDNADLEAQVRELQAEIERLKAE